MSSQLAAALEWIAAENTTLDKFCQIDSFSWGQRYLWPQGPDHGKFNFIRLLDNGIDKVRFDSIVGEQERVFKKHSKTLHIKISDSIFPSPPEFLSSYGITGSPLISILLRHTLIPELEARDSISIRECENEGDLEKYVRVNASGRDWSPDRPVYEVIREAFATRADANSYYLLYVGDVPACTASIDYFGDKYNLCLLATHEDFQRRGLMNYLNTWIARKVEKDFYVQVNNDEPSFRYYANLDGAQIVNTEVKYALTT
jgi:hypothetical protein